MTGEKAVSFERDEYAKPRSGVGTFGKKIEKFLAADGIKGFPFGRELFIDFDRGFGHPLMRFLGTADQQKILPFCNSPSL